MTRFTVTDHLAAARAAEELREAAGRLVGRARAAVSRLDQRTADFPTPAEVLDGLAEWHHRQRRFADSEHELILLLAECGASTRGIADALGMHRSTVEARIRSARIARAEPDGTD